MENSNNKLSNQPTYIRFIEYTQKELDQKLHKARGIISSLMSISMNKSTDTFNSNRFGDAIESMVYEKIQSSEISARIFLDWYKNYESSINYCIKTGNLGDITLHSINCLIMKVQKESVSI